MALIALNCGAFKSSDCGGTSRSHYAENPVLNLGRLVRMLFKFKEEKLFESTVRICPLHPFDCCKSVLLVGRSPGARERPVPKPG